MSHLEELLPEFRKGAKIRRKDWDEDVFIYFYKDEIYWKDSGAWKDGKIASTKDLVSIFTLHDNDWEFYQEPIDWDYIIKNKCLCWFWDDLDSLENSSYGYLFRYNKYTQCFNDGKEWYKNCRPVHKDEVTFYEDRK